MDIIFSFFPLLYALIVPAGVIYFAVIIYKISYSLNRIANTLEKESNTKKNK